MSPEGLIQLFSGAAGAISVLTFGYILIFKGTLRIGRECDALIDAKNSEISTERYEKRMWRGIALQSVPVVERAVTIAEQQREAL